MGDLMAMPMGTGPSRDDLVEAVKNWRNCCPPIPKPLMLPGWKQSMMGIQIHVGKDVYKKKTILKDSTALLMSFRFCPLPDVLTTTIQTVPCICCISRAPCSIGLGAMMVVWVAWHRLTILGGGAVWGGTGMALQIDKRKINKEHCLVQTYM